jgi:hypothetical protein
MPLRQSGSFEAFDDAVGIISRLQEAAFSGESEYTDGERDGAPLGSHDIGSQGISKVIATKSAVYSVGKPHASQDSTSKFSPT